VRDWYQHSDERRHPLSKAGNKKHRHPFRPPVDGNRDHGVLRLNKQSCSCARRPVLFARLLALSIISAPY
jgi:hypothetical protein